MSSRFRLAEVNVAVMRAPLDDPQMAEFAQALAAVNVAADVSPGFVWRLQTDAGDSSKSSASRGGAGAPPSTLSRK